MNILDYFTLPMLGAFSFILLVVFYLPFVIYLTVKIWRLIPKNIGIKLMGVFFLNIVLWAIPLWDAIFATAQFKNACNNEAGYFLYQKVDGVEGVEAIYSGEARIFVDEGMRFAEYRDTLGMHRVEMVDGKLTDTIVAKLKSKFRFYNEEKILSKYLKKSSYILINKETNNKIGEVIYFYFYPGWLDRLTLGWMGYQPVVCNKPKGQRIKTWELVIDAFSITK